VHLRERSRLDEPTHRLESLRGRKRQLMFFGGSLECLRRILDPVNYLVVSLNRDPADDLVLAARGIVLERSFEIYKLTDRVFMHHSPAMAPSFARLGAAVDETNATGFALAFSSKEIRRPADL
jgi:hypothetical protein